MIVLIVVEIEFDTLIVPKGYFHLVTSKSNAFPKSKLGELIQML